MLRARESGTRTKPGASPFTVADTRRLLEYLDFKEADQRNWLANTAARL